MKPVKIKPGTMAEKVFPGKTHFVIEFEGEKKLDPVLREAVLNEVGYLEENAWNTQSKG